MLTDVQRIGKAISVLEDAIDTDNRYWEELDTGQNSEEAESSGYLLGYRDALSAAHMLFAHGDTSTLEGYLDAIRETMTDQREETTKARV